MNKQKHTLQQESVDGFGSAEIAVFPSLSLPFHHRAANLKQLIRAITVCHFPFFAPVSLEYFWVTF